ncbi:response regulator [Pseudidiomarina salinarum]|uniref:response regulator n=1 Tax=Pseudidiomarina salinarum TaxID=435908 RepID=UPI000690B8E2|nr:response regulator [Pseudidiomarina salinarum]RUO70631.1 response regulator [Pseudidiomarina salinarum]
MSLSLLLVEDKPATRNTLLQALADSPFTVTCATDGLDGLSQAKSNVYDVVLLDHKMPLMDGLALLRNLRELPDYRETPLILMTTQELQQVEAAAAKAGADLCLAKPIDNKRLLGLLKDLGRSMLPPECRTA